jgi:hypothetical protein
MSPKCPFPLHHIVPMHHVVIMHHPSFRCTTPSTPTCSIHHPVYTPPPGHPYTIPLVMHHTLEAPHLHLPCDPSMHHTISIEFPTCLKIDAVCNSAQCGVVVELSPMVDQWSTCAHSLYWSSGMMSTPGPYSAHCGWSASLWSENRNCSLQKLKHVAYTYTNTLISRQLCSLSETTSMNTETMGTHPCSMLMNHGRWSRDASPVVGSWLGNSHVARVKSSGCQWAAFSSISKFVGEQYKKKSIKNQ